MKRQTRLIAHYLPQFHPIPENDTWWGKGFTEWTNVVKAKPLFPGHHQPNLPADLGFYDLRVPETRAAQAELAEAHGIEGFCYWHYWFGNGRRLLERPFEEVLRSGEPDYPFCLAWANQSWTGIWHGSPDKVLIEQTYPGEKDHEAHFYALLDAFADERYLTARGRPIFIVYDPYNLPEPRRFADQWRMLAEKAGLRGVYLIGIAGIGWSPAEQGFDAAIVSNPSVALAQLGHFQPRRARAFWGKRLSSSLGRLTKKLARRPRVYSYQAYIEQALPKPPRGIERYPCVVPRWDNTPRSGLSGVVLDDSTPELFKTHLMDALRQVRELELQHPLIFVKSWNEWAEGNYLEPDQAFGTSYLKAIEDVMLQESEKIAEPMKARAG